MTDEYDPDTDPEFEWVDPPKVHGSKLEKVEKVWNARIAGASWRQAAEIGGYSTASNARTAVRSLRGELPVLDREHARDLWRERIEVLWQQALRDVAAQRPGAITAAVRVVTAATQLDGLNDQTYPGPANAQFNQVLLFLQEKPATIHPIVEGEAS